MTTQTTKSLSRKITLVLGALVVSIISIAGASQANAGVKVYLGWGGGGWGGGPVIGGNICDYFWFKYQKTGKFKYKEKYMKCMGYW